VRGSCAPRNCSRLYPLQQPNNLLAVSRCELRIYDVLGVYGAIGTAEPKTRQPNKRGLSAVVRAAAAGSHNSQILKASGDPLNLTRLHPIVSSTKSSHCRIQTYAHSCNLVTYSETGDGRASGPLWHLLNMKSRKKHARRFFCAPIYPIYKIALQKMG
jgi:hypothetical protein